MILPRHGTGEDLPVQALAEFFGSHIEIVLGWEPEPERRRAMGWHDSASHSEAFQDGREISSR